MAALALLFFASYSAALGDPSVHTLRVAVAAPQEASRVLGSTEGLDLVRVPTGGQVRELVGSRQVDGGLSLTTSDGVVVYVATGGGPSVARAVTTVGQAVAAGLGVSTTTVDVAPLGDRDPSGTIEFYGVVFLSMTASLGAAVLLMVMGTPRTLRALAMRLVALALQSLLIGAVLTAASSWWLGATPQAPGVQFVVFSASGLAIAMAATGVGAVCGRLGSLLLVLLLTALGNATAGGPVGAPLLSPIFAALNSVLPQAAALSLTRSYLYFAGAGTASAVRCLLAWATAGLVMAAAPVLRAARHRRPLRA